MRHDGQRLGNGDQPAHMWGTTAGRMDGIAATTAVGGCRYVGMKQADVEVDLNKAIS